MDYNQLEETIKKIIFEEFEKTGSIKSSFTKKTKNIVVLIPKEVFSFGTYFEFLSKQLKMCNVVFVFEEYSVVYEKYMEKADYIDLSEKEKRLELFDKTDEYDEALVLVSKVNSVDEILNIRSSNIISNIINQFLMQEIDIKALWSYKKENKRSKEIRNAQKQLEFLEIKSENIKCIEQEKQREQQLKSKVISEKDIFKARSEGELSIVALKEQLITPLAKDRARELGIRIERE